MTSDLEYRTLQIDGEATQLLWPAQDVGCFNIIASDWGLMNEQIIRFTPNRGIVIQAGGNCGMYPLLHSKQFEFVLTFEPDPINFHCLAHNCTSSKIMKFNAAVGAKAEPLMMGVVEPLNIGMNKIGAGDTVVYCLPIDCLDLQVLSLLHLDIEGHEFPALRGAEQTIMRCRPTIAVELSQDVEETKRYIESLNYREVFNETSNSANFIFIPSERT